jgi:hypothetical protein
VEHYLLDRSGRPSFDISLYGIVFGFSCLWLMVKSVITNEKTRESAIRHTKE